MVAGGPACRLFGKVALQTTFGPNFQTLNCLKERFA